MQTLDELNASLAPARRQLLEHPVYRHLVEPAALRIFMEHHVWAVWDFMSLLARLQSDLTCTTVPWLPTNVPPSLRRFVNEIKLGEESDRHPDGETFTSHFELYVEAMYEVGADPETALKVLDALRRSPLSTIAIVEAAPLAAAEFAHGTLNVARHGTTLQVAASFCLGREQLIPDMFRPIIARLGGAPIFAEYLARHVELDEGEHGPMAQRLVAYLAEQEPDGWNIAYRQALSSISARRRLWNGVLRAIGDARLPSST